MDRQDNAKSTRAKLLNFVKITILYDILNAFTETTGLMANIVDNNGKSIFSKSDLSKCCKFCRLIYEMKGGLKRCQGAYKRAGKQAALFGEPYIFRCPAGLIEWAAPIVVDGQHLGTLICGQVLMWEPEEFFWIELREMNKELTSDFTELFKAVEELPIVSPSMVKSASYLMYIVSNYIMKSGWDNYIHTQEISYQQALLHQEIENRKKIEDKLADKPLPNSLAKENKLILKMKFGENEAAAELFQICLTDIMLESKNNVSMVQSGVIELCVIISRCALDMGVAHSRIRDLNAAAFKKILKEESSVAVCVQGQKLMSDYMDEIRQRKDEPHNAKVATIKSYIHENFRENLTLEKISSAAYLSPSYASRLFKQTQNISIMDYLTQTRMAEAKRLLKNSKYLIDEIAENVGYTDSSYFTKVFRRCEGITPTQYRKSLQT